VVGCTTAGEISSVGGYQSGGLVGVALGSPGLRVHPRLLYPLNNLEPQGVRSVIEDLSANLTFDEELAPERDFGFLLVDGLSSREEELAEILYENLGGVPFFGGSASDDLHFEHTYVYYGGLFYTNAALFTLFESRLPFEIFRIQHFEPTDTKVVITEADGPSRTVYEINGKPAAEEYARLIGVTPEKLNPTLFAANPLMVPIGGEHFIRSVLSANEDGSLTFACAIETGLVLSLGRGADPISNLRANLQELKDKIGSPRLFLGCDCLWRRLELTEKELLQEAKDVLASTEFVGFSSYGEQFKGLHVNQTLTGLVLGE
jgi:hypothetical protein